MQNIGHILVFSVCNGGCGEPWGKARRVVAAEYVEVAYLVYLEKGKGEGEKVLEIQIFAGNSSQTV